MRTGKKLPDFRLREAAVGRVRKEEKVSFKAINQSISELWTVDRDFSRFPALKTHNPLS